MLILTLMLMNPSKITKDEQTSNKQKKQKERNTDYIESVQEKPNV